MRLNKVTLRQIRMPLVKPFETSFGRTEERQIILVEVETEGISGWGEVTAGEGPFYNEEWTDGAWMILRGYAVPAVLGRDFAGPDDVSALTAQIRGHRMARGGLEAAVWDLAARQEGVPLWKKIGAGARQEIPCGVSIGIQGFKGELLDVIERELAAGYQRIKIKIKPGWDVDVVEAVRTRLPKIMLSVDANSAYTLNDLEHLRRLDDFDLLMIEQPLAHDDIIDHARLQERLRTAICLDESIRTAHHAEQALRLGACRIINIKLGRVGGFAEAKRVHDVAYAAGAPVWCGGMLESGVGRAHNIALASLPNFTLPGDVSASKRYWPRDIITPQVEVTAEGTIVLRENSGFGYDLDCDLIRRITVREESIG